MYLSYGPPRVFTFRANVGFKMPNVNYTVVYNCELFLTTDLLFPRGWYVKLPDKYSEYWSISLLHFDGKY